MNIEHRTSNIERRMKGNSTVLAVDSMFDVGRSMFDVRLYVL